MPEDRTDTLALFRSNVRNAQSRIRAVLREQAEQDTAQWACSHCGAQRSREDRWWPADLLREAVGIDGTVAMTAVTDLVNQGVLELDTHLRVRLAT